MLSGLVKNAPKDELKRLLFNFFRILLTLSAIVLVCIFIGYGWRLQSAVAFLTISGAYLLAGIVLGFLFGMPRSAKFRYQPGISSNGQDDSPMYTDNTNLEDVSDWLTKIIVGLSLVNFEKILKYTDSSAIGIAISLSGRANSGAAYSLSYALIFLFLLSGFIASYLWSFAILRSILIRRKQQDKKVVETTLNNVAGLLSKEAVERQENAYTGRQLTEAMVKGYDVDGNFKAKVSQALKEHPVKNEYMDDLQRGRWGGKKVDGHKRISAEVTESRLYPLFFDVVLQVSSTDPANPYRGMVAFFVHDSFGFPEDTIYAKAGENGIASIPLVAYEAFTVGALCEEDGTLLEINLNKEPGFPDKFYYRD